MVTILFQQWFSMTFPWPKNEFPWPIGTTYFFEINDTRFMNAYQNKNFSSCKQDGIYRNKYSIAFLKKNPGYHHYFPWLSMTLAVFHDFPGLENGLTKFHDFSGRVVTLYVSTPNQKLKLDVWTRSAAKILAMPVAGEHKSCALSSLLLLQVKVTYFCLTACKTASKYQFIY